MNKIKELLENNDYAVTINIVDNIIFLKYIDEMIGYYEIDRKLNKVKITSQDFNREYDLKDYYFGTFIYYHILCALEVIPFPVEYVDIYLEGAKIDIETFLVFLGTNKDFHELINRSYNKLYPFHFTFDIEAYHRDYADGYYLLKALLIGD